MEIINSYECRTGQFVACGTLALHVDTGQGTITFLLAASGLRSLRTSQLLFLSFVNIANGLSYALVWLLPCTGYTGADTMMQS
jgi:hypothetical protein